MSLLHLLPLANNVSGLIPLSVILFGCILLVDSSNTSLILCVLCWRITPTMNFLTRHFFFFPQIFVGPSSSTSNLALSRNIVSLTLCFKEWMVNGTVPLQLLCQIMNLVIIQDSGNHNALDASQVPNCVLLDSNQGAKDLSQDSKCPELNSHACGLSPMANGGHTVGCPIQSPTVVSIPWSYITNDEMTQR